VCPPVPRSSRNCREATEATTPPRRKPAVASRPGRWCAPTPRPAVGPFRLRPGDRGAGVHQRAGPHTGRRGPTRTSLDLWVVPGHQIGRRGGGASATAAGRRQSVDRRYGWHGARPDPSERHGRWRPAVYRIHGKGAQWSPQALVPSARAARRLRSRRPPPRSWSPVVSASARRRSSVSVSEIVPLTTGAVMTEASVDVDDLSATPTRPPPRSPWTSAGLLDSDLILYLFGTPASTGSGSCGTTWSGRHRRGRPGRHPTPGRRLRSIDFFEDRQLPYVIAINCSTGFLHHGSTTSATL